MNDDNTQSIPLPSAIYETMMATFVEGLTTNEDGVEALLRTMRHDEEAWRGFIEALVVFNEIPSHDNAKHLRETLHAAARDLWHAQARQFELPAVAHARAH